MTADNRIDEIKKRHYLTHVRTTPHLDQNWADIADLLAEVERLKARLAKADAVCEAVGWIKQSTLTLRHVGIPKLMKAWRESREH